MPIIAVGAMSALPLLISAMDGHHTTSHELSLTNFDRRYQTIIDRGLP